MAGSRRRKVDLDGGASIFAFGERRSSQSARAQHTVGRGEAKGQRTGPLSAFLSRLT